MNEENGLFAHPAGYSDTDRARELIATYCATIEFFRSLLEGLHTHLGRPHVREASAGFGLERLATAFTE